MGADRSCGRKAGVHVGLIVVIVASVLVGVAGTAHALTGCGAGCVAANEDDYLNVPFKDTGFTYTVDAAQGLLANDNGPATTKVDLQATVDDYATNPHKLTTDMGFTVTLYGDGHFTYTSDGTYSGNDSFLYYIWDGVTLDHSVSDFNFVNLTITPAIRPVTFVASGTLSSPVPGVLKNDAGVDPNTLTMDSVTAMGGTVDDDGYGAFTYTPPPGTPPATDSFKYNVLDINNDNGYDGTVTISTAIDSIKPIVAMNAPSVSVTLSPTFTVKWSGSDGGGSGVSHYDVQSQTSGSTGTYGSWTDWMMGTQANFASFAGSFGRSYCFRTRAVDFANNVSPWATRCTSVPLKAGSLSYSSGWQTLTNSAYFGGSAHRTTTKNATASRASVYAKRVWLVVTKSASSGTVQVLWNGVVKANLNLASSTTVHQQKVAALSFSSVQKGTLTIKVTSSGKGVTLEGLDVFLS
jgi:hypothetical protein